MFFQVNNIELRNKNKEKGKHLKKRKEERRKEKDRPNRRPENVLPRARNLQRRFDAETKAKRRNGQIISGKKREEEKKKKHGQRTNTR
jgi:hypothetical protein